MTGIISLRNVYSKPPARIPMNSMTKVPIAPNVNGQSNVKLSSGDSVPLDLLEDPKLGLELEPKDPSSNNLTASLLNGDDSLVDISCDSTEEQNVEVKSTNPSKAAEVQMTPACTEPEIKPLTDINVTLETIKPSNLIIF